jgi:hypothetical protein
LQHLKHDLQFDWGIQGELGGTDGDAGVATRIPKQIDEQVRGTVDHCRLLYKPFG